MTKFNDWFLANLAQESHLISKNGADHTLMLSDKTINFLWDKYQKELWDYVEKDCQNANVNGNPFLYLAQIIYDNLPARFARLQVTLIWYACEVCAENYLNQLEKKQRMTLTKAQEQTKTKTQQFADTLCNKRSKS